MHRLLPGIRDEIKETFLSDPNRAELEGDGAKLFPTRQRERNGFMVRSVVREDPRGLHKT